ncbi:MAG: hypothetical protein J7K23_04195 [Thermoproteales archaeon]|nr:hypothetical protein [Thermoproteales archaeon]
MYENIVYFFTIFSLFLFFYGYHYRDKDDDAILWVMASIPMFVITGVLWLQVDVLACTSNECTLMRVGDPSLAAIFYLLAGFAFIYSLYWWLIVYSKRVMPR